MSFSMSARPIACAVVLFAGSNALQSPVSVQQQHQVQPVQERPWLSAVPLEAYAKRQDDLLRDELSRRMSAHTSLHDMDPVLHGGATEGQLKQKFKQYEGQTVFIFGAYHKTGCELAVNVMARLRHDHNTDDINLVGDALEQEHTKVFLPGKWDNFYYEPRLGILNLLPDFRLVHMVRDPVEIVVSAYRFHAQCPPGEPWLLEPMATMYDLEHMKLKLLQWNRNLLKKVKRAVNKNVSLCELYQQDDISEQEGVVIESFRSQRELELIAGNYAKTARNPRVLQVPMESILADFSGTMDCIFSFLGEFRAVDKSDSLDKIKQLDISKAPEIDPTHVTHGKYDNAEIVKTVSAMPHVVASREALHWHQTKSNTCGKF